MMINFKSSHSLINIRTLFVVTLFVSLISTASAQQKAIWTIGKADNQSTGLALAPAAYKDFLAHDFGWEDQYYLVGFSNPAKDFPYVLPGPKDSWGGTAPTAGIRSHLLNILFDLKKVSSTNTFKLAIDLVGYNGEKPPLFKVNINGRGVVQQLPKGEKSNVVGGDMTAAKEYIIQVPIKAGQLHDGGNEIQLTSLDGSWLVFDQVRLEGPLAVNVQTPKAVYPRSVAAANYELIEQGKRIQPLLIDVEHLTGQPTLAVKLDGKLVFQEKIETGRYQFEVPMPAVTNAKNSKYEVLANGQLLESGVISRSAKPLGSYANYVDTRIGTAHSRWMIGPGPWMPFSMVKLSPDNQNAGWQAGYDPTFESIGAFSHIHEWTMGGLGMLPVNGPLKTKVGDQRSAPGEGYRSRIDKSTEEAPLGSYKVDLIDYGIKAEVTATSRASFMKYTYPKATDSRVMIDLQTPAENRYNLAEVTLKKVSDYRIECYSKQFAPQVWIAQAGSSEQEYIVHFVIEFDQPIKKFGTWVDDQVGSQDLINIKDPKDAGAFVEFDTRQNQVVQMRTGIS